MSDSVHLHLRSLRRLSAPCPSRVAPSKSEPRHVQRPRSASHRSDPPIQGPGYAPGGSRGWDSLTVGCARGRPGVGTHSRPSVPRVDTHSESRGGVPDPPRTGASVMNTSLSCATVHAMLPIPPPWSMKCEADYAHGCRDCRECVLPPPLRADSKMESKAAHTTR